MPGFMTHIVFGEKTAELIHSAELKTILAEHEAAYHLGSQGPDIFFYNPLSLLQSGYRNTGSYMHEHNTNVFFRNCLLEIERQKEAHTRRLMLAYLAGFISHHYLDRTAHPYIYWYTYQLNGKQQKDSFRIHSGIETNIDGSYTVKYLHQKPCSIQRQDLIHLSDGDLETISTLLSHCLKQTFEAATNSHSLCFHPAYIALTIRATGIAQDVLKDHSGQKKKIIRKVQNSRLPDPLLTGMIISDHPDNLGDCMNLSHSCWENPWDDTYVSTASFPELFHKAAVECAEIFDLLSPQSLWTAKNPSLYIRAVTDKIGDRSYHSGLLNT